MTIVVKLHRHSNNCQKMGNDLRVCRSEQAYLVHESDLSEVQILYMHDKQTDTIRSTAVIATLCAYRANRGFWVICS